jgi:O-antigen/teichoic acid export membrane protein
VTASTSETESIGRKAGRGLRWSLVGNLVIRIGSFAIGLVLARLLTPADFGIYAIALAATQFVMNVKDVGIIAATVQWRGRLEEMAPTASTLAFVFSTVLYAIFWFGAPTFATLAGNPDAAGVVRLLTAVILVEAVTAVRAGVLMREFRQDLLIIGNLVGLGVNALVAIALAGSGAGPYSFAAGQVAGSVVTGIIVFVAARVPVRVGMDFAVAGRLMRFGIPLAASLGVEAVLLNVQFLIIGSALGATSLGYYLLAFNVSTWALSVISSAVRYVSVAGFSRLSEHDAETLSGGVQRTIPMLYTLLVPIAVLTAVLAGPLVFVLYGQQWLPAAPALQFLMVLTAVRMLTSFNFDILAGAGATRWALWVNLGWCAAVIPAIWIGVQLDGIRGAAIAHAIVGVLVALPLSVLALARIGVAVGPIVPALARPTLAGVLSAGVALLVASATSSTTADFFLAGAAGVLTYALTAVPRRKIRQWLGAGRREEAHAVQ